MLRVRNELRGEIESVLAKSGYQLYCESHEIQSLYEFIKNERDFLGAQDIQEEPVQLYFKTLQVYQKILSEHCFKLRKDFLEEQIRIIGIAKAVVV